MFPWVPFLIRLSFQFCLDPVFFAFDFDFAHVSKFPCLSLVPVFVASHFYLPVFLFPEAGEMAANGKASGVYSNCCTGSKTEL